VYRSHVRSYDVPDLTTETRLARWTCELSRDGKVIGEWFLVPGPGAYPWCYWTRVTMRASHQRFTSPAVLETTTLIAWLRSYVGECDISEWHSTEDKGSLTCPFEEDPC
jgi:hypothetical protein